MHYSSANSFTSLLAGTSSLLFIPLTMFLNLLPAPSVSCLPSFYDPTYSDVSAAFLKDFVLLKIGCAFTFSINVLSLAPLRDSLSVSFACSSSNLSAFY